MAYRLAVVCAMDVEPRKARDPVEDASAFPLRTLVPRLWGTGVWIACMITICDVLKSHVDKGLCRGLVSDRPASGHTLQLVVGEGKVRIVIWDSA